MISQNFLIILTGLPASGKSTFSNIFKKAIRDKTKLNVVIVDPDTIRETYYPSKFDYKNEQEVRSQNLDLIKSALKEKSIVISDDLNYYTSMRHDLKQIAEKLKIPYYIIYISTPLDVCISWNQERGLKIPNSIIENVNNKFDYFDNYNWDRPFDVFDLSEKINLHHKIENLIQKLEKDLGLTYTNNFISNHRDYSNEDYNRALDKITREIVGNLIQKTLYQRKKKIILTLRKEFIKQSLKFPLDKSKISEEFYIFLQEHLELEKS